MDELYNHALAHETTAELFAGYNIEGLKAVQKSHWELTFKSGVDTSYEARAQRADSAAESIQSVAPALEEIGSSRKSQIKPNFWPSTWQSKVPAIWQ